MKEKTEIEIEFTETIAYSRPGERVEAFCLGCEASTEMASPHVAAIMVRMTEREIYRLVEDGKVHFVETDNVLVCLNSLADTLSKQHAKVENIGGK